MSCYGFLPQEPYHFEAKVALSGSKSFVPWMKVGAQNFGGIWGNDGRLQTMAFVVGSNRLFEFFLQERLKFADAVEPAMQLYLEERCVDGSSVWKSAARTMAVFMAFLILLFLTSKWSPQH